MSAKFARLPVYCRAGPLSAATHHNLQKPWLLAECWSQWGLPIELRDADAFAADEAKRVHDSKYISEVLDGKRDNGFGTRDPSIPAFDLWIAGAIYAAAKDGLQTKGISGVLGLMGHHAHYSLERGYCTFHNGLMAGERLRAEGIVRKIGILDYDFHEGDGTNHILQTLDLKEFYAHYSSGYEYGKHSSARDFLSRIPQHMSLFKDCDILIYHSGVDPHIDDRVGGWMTAHEIYEREYKVFSEALKMSLPVIWCLGGGYQRDAAGQPKLGKIVALHTQTVLAALCASVSVGLDELRL